MAIRKILNIGDTTLRKRSKVVENIDPKIHQLLDDLADTMYENQGAGLAAPQVGILKRIVVIDIGEGLIELINPSIINKKGKQSEEEGCLSVPGKRGKVNRPLKVTVEGTSRHGEKITIDGEGYLAVAICHELDHLDGVLFVDRCAECYDE